MFIGEFFCYFAYQFLKWRNPSEHEKNKQTALNKGLKLKGATPWLLIPALSDFLTTSLQFFGLILIDPSVYQMLRGGVIIITALFSVVFLQRKISQNQMVGIFLAVIGITVVGFSALFRNNDNLELSVKIFNGKNNEFLL